MWRCFPVYLFGLSKIPLAFVTLLACIRSFLGSDPLPRFYIKVQLVSLAKTHNKAPENKPQIKQICLVYAKFKCNEFRGESAWSPFGTTGLPSYSSL